MTMSDDPRVGLGALLADGADGLRPRLVDLLPGPWHRREVGDTPVDEPGPDVRAADLYDFEDEGLVQAAMAALVLGQPMIIAGEPGVGKTQFASALAARLGLAMQPTFNVKSGSAGIDLFYTYDDVARFRDAVGAGAKRLAAGTSASGSERAGGLASGLASGLGALRDYVRFSALGRAILWSAGPNAIVPCGEVPAEEIAGAEHAGRDTFELRELFPSAFRAHENGGYRQLEAPERSVALVDEFDKAPTDAPNDILAEVDQMSFRIKELDVVVSARPEAWPVLFITSNSERSLPDAFLRRCVFHWIEFPEEQRLARIVATHCVRTRGGDLPPDSRLMTSSVALFMHVRGACANKPPATAELIAFVLTMLEMGLSADDTVDLADERVRRLLGILLKTRVDFEQVLAEMAP